MTNEVVLRRSALYMPASNARAIEKARRLPADVIILDLEDSVASSQKETARHQASEAAKEGGFGRREVVIRINGENTPWHEVDLGMAIDANPDGILLPKVESPECVQRTAKRIESASPNARTKLWCMLETPRGVLAANDILRSHSRLAVAVMGTSDLARDLRAQHTATRLPLITSLGLCLLAARANRVALLDGVSLDLEDEAGFRQSCAQSRELGFDGKTLIHPKQIDACNAAFSPTRAEVAEAETVVAAYFMARERGEAVTVVGGRLVEELHVSEAQRILGIHQALNQAGRG